MVASEAVPFAKTGGLADVMGALPDALVAAGWDVTVVMPRYRGMDAGRLLERRWIAVGGQTVDVGYYEASLGRARVGEQTAVEPPRRNLAAGTVLPGTFLSRRTASRSPQLRVPTPSRDPERGIMCRIVSRILVRTSWFGWCSMDRREENESIGVQRRHDNSAEHASVPAMNWRLE